MFQHGFLRALQVLLMLPQIDQHSFRKFCEHRRLRTYLKIREDMRKCPFHHVLFISTHDSFCVASSTALLYSDDVFWFLHSKPPCVLVVFCAQKKGFEQRNGAIRAKPQQLDTCNPHCHIVMLTDCQVLSCLLLVYKSTSNWIDHS